MGNIEKHHKHALEQLEQAEFSAVSTHARAPPVIGPITKYPQSDGWGRRGEGHSRPVILRLEDLPATPGNIERIREQVRLMNRRLMASGTPFRLKVI